MVSAETKVDATSSTWVDSASAGNHALASLFWASASLPARGPRAATAATQKTMTAYLT